MSTNLGHRSLLRRVRFVVVGASMALLTAAAATGCGARTFEETVTVTPAIVVGAVGGTVYDFNSGAAIEGLAVQVIAGDAVYGGTTDVDGFFSVPDVPAGGPLVVRVDGGPAFTSAVTSAVLPVAAGQQPLEMPETHLDPIGLLPRTFGFSVQLVDTAGSPLAGATVDVSTGVEWFSLSPAETAWGVFSTTATADGSGIINFSGLPDLVSMSSLVATDDLRFDVRATDSNGDGIYETAGAVFTRPAQSLDSGLNVFDLDFEATNLTAVASNVFGLSASVQADWTPSTVDGPLHVVLNHPVDDSTVAVLVGDEEGVAVSGAAVAAMTAPFNRITVLPPPAGWPTGAELNVEVFAESAASHPVVAFHGAGWAFTASGAAVTVTASRRPSNTDIIDLTFSEPIGYQPALDWVLSGGDCPIFIMFDLNGNGNLNDVNEANGASCGISLFGDEPNPFGLSNVSGFTTRASFTTPITIPGQFSFDVRFSRVGTAVNRPTTADGTLVPDLTVTVN